MVWRIQRKNRRRKTMSSNTSGAQPVEYKVIIKVDKVDEKTAGGIYLPEIVQEMDQNAHTRGVLVEIGGNAFEHFEEPIPRRGQRVMFGRYVGMKFVGADGEEYRALNDKEIIVIFEKEFEGDI
jgi:chaperonin GroES